MPDESARARERWVVVNVRAFGVAQIAPSERERERHSYIGKREFEPGVPWPAPPLWRSFYLVSNPEKLRDNYTTRHRAPLVAKRSFPRRPAPDARRGATNTRERERKEREFDKKNPIIILVSFFFLFKFFPSFLFGSVFSRHFSLSLSLSHQRETKLME